MGDVKNGFMHGYGEFLWPDGKKYCGNYLNDKKDGFGAYLWKLNPLDAYFGFWENGLQHGIGIKMKHKRVKYGFWVNGKKECWLQGPWEMKKYAKLDQFKYIKFLSKNFKEMLFILS